MPSNMLIYTSVLQHSFSAVMHFAGLKAVGESVEQPLRYYRVNLTASMNLLEVSFAFCQLTAPSSNSALALIIVLICRVHDNVCSFDTKFANSNTASFITFIYPFYLLLVYCICVCRV